MTQEQSSLVVARRSRQQGLRGDRAAGGWVSCSWRKSILFVLCASLWLFEGGASGDPAGFRLHQSILGAAAGSTYLREKTPLRVEKNCFWLLCITHII